MPLKKRPNEREQIAVMFAEERSCRLSGPCRLSGQADLGELAQVLSGSSEVKLASGTIGAT